MRFSRVVFTLMLTSATGSGQTLLPAPSGGFLKNLTVESFGLEGSPTAVGYEFNPGFDAAFYNLHHLTCPLCTPGRPVSRTRAILPPFGTTASYRLLGDRLALFSSFGGIDAVPTDNGPRLNPVLMRATSFNDDWIVTSNVGANIAVDPQKQLWLGFTQSHVEDFGPLKRKWNSTAGSVSVTPDLVRKLAHSVKKIEKSTQDTPQKQP